MELTAVPATQFSSVQLTDILNACFEAYLVPVTQSVEGFVQRFSAEGMSLVDSRVWLAGDEPAAIAIVAADSSMKSSSDSMRSFVRSVSGRKIAQTSAFHTHPHLSSASTGKSAPIPETLRAKVS